MTDVKRIAIIGNGCAAAECVIALRKHGYYDEIRLFADNRNEIANPMLTTYYASRRIPFEYMFHYGDAFYGRFGVDFRYDCPVMALKAVEKRLEAGATPLDAALSCGFADQSHFSNHFKRLIGLTPRQYANIFTKEEPRRA